MREIRDNLEHIFLRLVDRDAPWDDGVRDITRYLADELDEIKNRLELLEYDYDG